MQNLKLNNYRKKIDIIDEKMIKLLSRRFSYLKKIGTLKQKNNMPIIDKTREQEKIKRLQGLAKQHHMNPLSIAHIWKAIFKESYEHQK